MKTPIFILMGATLMLLALADASADVLFLTNGKLMKGIIVEEESDERSVKFISAQATLNVQRSRIKEIQNESPAQGYVHIGDDLRAAEKLTEATTYYQMALQADPNFEPAKNALAEIQSSMDDKQSKMRDGDIAQIDDLRAEIRRLMRLEEFRQGEELLKKANDLQPTEDQKLELRKLVAELYFEWGKSRLDKFDNTGAEDYLNKALAADPENDEAIELLLSLWEDKPDKMADILRIYESVLKRRPEDEVLRRRVAEMYYRQGLLVDSAFHFLKIYQDNERYKGTQLEGILIENLDRLHAKFAQEKNYDQAIVYYQAMMNLDPNADPTGVFYYEYLKMANETPREDTQGWLELAGWAEEHAMPQESIDIYKRVIAEQPTNELARAGLNRFALDLVKQAEASMARKEYHLAQAIAKQVQGSFPGSEEAGIRAQEIAVMAGKEIERMQAQSREVALAYVERGDTFYFQAKEAYEQIFRTDRQTLSRISTPKNDAIRYFQAAIGAYTQALAIDATLNQDPALLVGPRLSESQAFLNRLTQSPPTRRTYDTLGDPQPRAGTQNRR